MVGFCLIFGVLLSTDKFRAFAVNRSEHSGRGRCMPSQGKTQRDGKLKHMGVLWDMELSNGTQLCEANAVLNRHLDRIALKTGSKESKWMVIWG